MLSMHVRHGDSCLLDEELSSHRRCEPLSVYMETAVLPMAQWYGVKTIFLATDDEVVLRETAQWPQFVWLFDQNQNRSKTKSLEKWDYLLRRGALDGFGEATSALTDLLLLSEGDAFVGKFTSNIDRLAYALLVGKKMGLAPYASLDSAWCMDFGQPAGSGIHGNFQC
jgi:hypothetical protein